MKKSDVEIYYDRHYGAHPSIDVRVYGFGNKLDESDFNCDKDCFEKAMQFAWESQQEYFWDEAVDIAKDIFGKNAKVLSLGRSGGHLIVEGIPDIESWDAVYLAKWRGFRQRILQLIEWLTSDTAIKELIIANRWTEPGAELYNFIEKKDGTSFCLSEMKAKAIAAGYGPVVRM